MREEDIDRIERITVMRNDQRVREQARQGSTYKAFADADAELPGRFQSIAAAHVVGSTPIPKYPELPANSPFHHDPVPNEPPLGLTNPAIEPSTDLSAVEHLGAPAAEVAPPPDRLPPITDGVEPGAGAPPSSPEGQR